MEPAKPPRPEADGSTPATAIVVGSVAEEYAWIARNRPGARFLGQKLAGFEGKMIDVLILEVAPGEVREVYFDISSSFGDMRGADQATAPCPYCEASLRTDRAKQCFECGMDWRDPANVVRRGGVG